MKKLNVFMLFILLCLASVSTVVADYRLPTATVDILDPVAGVLCTSISPEDSDAQTINNRALIGDPCCLLAVPSDETIDKRALVGSDSCCLLAAPSDETISDRALVGIPLDCFEDPCDSEELNHAIIPEAIAFNGYGVEKLSFDDIFGEPIEDPCSIEKSNEEEDDDEPYDTDGDGYFDFEDNCPFVPNEDQLNTFGTQSGDACEEPYRSDNGLVYGFVGSELIGFWGFCTEDGCQLIVGVNPVDFDNITGDDAGEYGDELEGGIILNLEEGNPTRMAVLYEIGTDDDGNTVYQINIYILLQQLNDDGSVSAFPMLVDDDFTVVVDADGNWTWYDNNPN